MYVLHNIGERSCNHCCCGKAISITYSECVFVASVIQHAMLMRRVILSSVASPPLQHFPHYFIYGTVKKKVNDHKMRVLIFSATFVWNISHSKKNWARYDHNRTMIRVKQAYLLFLSDFTETWIFSTEFQKYLSIKFHENPSSDRRLVPCGHTYILTWQS